MADERQMSLLGLIILSSFLTGTCEMDNSVFHSSGENVRLPCNNALSDCTSTTWTYSRQSKTVELIAGGIKKKDIERHERLSLGSDCSLNIKKVTKEDHGFYNCQQYVNSPPSDAPVYLHVLYVSSSSSQSEISPGSSVTLFCQLFYDKVSCDALVRTEGVQLIWVNEAGVNLQTDPRYKISFSPEHCYSSLTTKLLSEDLNREWRCQVTQRNQVRTTAPYTLKHADPSTDPSESQEHATVIVSSAVAAVLAFALVAVFCVIRKKRAGNKKGTGSSVVNSVKDSNEHKGTYETINMSDPTMPDTSEQTDDVTYSEVTASSKNPVQVRYNDSDHTVTYAAIERREH
ncbi:uncharacterized protein LOC122360165 isoform X1 [Puntigrus tetrazona]|uniref:uncharacterized protein LOC122360165 isoform X1 n=1 Tax=Puntigrus tetrazona TaxID=1606681 RepID=UPI001C8A56C0|nr:uncharacterized protein LOC122360165 isoform X1 [Puntigrus tetrazona]